MNTMLLLATSGVEILLALAALGLAGLLASWGLRWAAGLLAGVGLLQLLLTASGVGVVFAGQRLTDLLGFEIAIWVSRAVWTGIGLGHALQLALLMSAALVERPPPGEAPGGTFLA